MVVELKLAGFPIHGFIQGGAYATH